MPWNLVCVPLGFMGFLQNNNHQAVNKILLTAYGLLFCKNSMKRRDRRLNSIALNV